MMVYQQKLLRFDYPNLTDRVPNNLEKKNSLALSLFLKYITRPAN